MTICKVCGSKVETYLKDIYDVRYGYPDLFNIRCCTNCGFFQSEPPLKQSEIGPLYTNYYPYADTNVEKIKSGFHAEIGAGSRFKNWLRGNHRIQNMLPVGSGKVLEVGCGDGRSLLQLKALGYDAYGVEADENIRPIATKLGLNIHIGTIENADFPPSTFDLIVANQLIEHIVDLDSFMINAKKFLKTDGTLILSTPNAGGLYRRLFGRSWLNWHIPFHQQVFTSGSMTIFLHKHNFTITKIKTVSPTAWTLHQLEALRHNIKIGEKNPYWMMKKNGSKEKEVRSRRYDFSFKKIILKTMVFIITVFNRVLDFLRLGDCLVVYTKMT